jgi:hypothetical protein
MVSVEVVLLLELTVRVEVPEPTTEAGLNVPVVFRGKVTLKFTVPEKPLSAPTVTV